MPAVRARPQLGLALDDEVMVGRRVGEATIATADGEGGFCLRVTSARGDPMQPATANSSMIMAPYG